MTDRRRFDLFRQRRGWMNVTAKELKRIIGEEKPDEKLPPGNPPDYDFDIGNKILPFNSRYGRIPK